jgi:hypothetical protein
MIIACCNFGLKILQYFALGQTSLLYCPLCLFGMVLILMLDDPSLEAKAGPLLAFLVNRLGLLVPLSQVVKAHTPALLEMSPGR